MLPMIQQLIAEAYNNFANFTIDNMATILTILAAIVLSALALNLIGVAQSEEPTTNKYNTTPTALAITLHQTKNKDN